eukprot:scaffold239433_cov40-Prasinocladus_malaysianus.AAC.1
MQTAATTVRHSLPEPVSLGKVSPARPRPGSKSARKARPRSQPQMPAKKVQSAVKSDSHSHKSPLASVLEQYRAAETSWAQEKAKLRRELIEQRKRANKFENDYKKLVVRWHFGCLILIKKQALHGIMVLPSHGVSHFWPR